MAKWKPGQPSPNPNGRPKGSVNRISTELRNSIALFLRHEFPNVKRAFHKLDAEKKIKTYTDLLDFILPKLKSQELDISFDKLTDEQVDLIMENLKKAANEQSK